MDTKNLIEKAKKESIEDSIKKGIEELDEEMKTSPSVGDAWGTDPYNGIAKATTAMLDNQVLTTNTATVTDYNYVTPDNGPAKLRFQMDTSYGTTECFTWDPKPDITPFELAQAIPIFLGGTQLSEDLFSTTSLARHFKHDTLDQLKR